LLADAHGLARLGLASANVRGDGSQDVRPLAPAGRAPVQLVETGDVLPHAADLPLPVEEADRRDLHVVVRDHQEGLAGREAPPLPGRRPRDRRALDSIRAYALEARVRERAGPLRVDVLRLLEVRGDELHELGSRLEGECLTRYGERGDAGSWVEERRANRRPPLRRPEVELQRERIDARLRVRDLHDDSGAPA